MTLLRYVLAFAMLAHGVAHLPGVIASWRLKTLPDLPYHTALLRGRFDVGDVGMRIMGALWLLAAIGFWLAFDGAVTGHPRWRLLALAAALLSFALCSLEWPQARVGLWVDVVLIATLVLLARFAAA